MSILFWLLSLISLSNLKHLAHSVQEETYQEDYHQWINDQINHINRSNWNLVDRPNLIRELRMMVANTATVREHLHNIILNLLKMVCDPLNRHLKSWMAQVDNFRQTIMRIPKDDNRVKANLKEYDQIADKRTKDNRELTRLEKVLEEEWKACTENKKEHIAFAVWINSERTITFYKVPKECPLTLEQVLRLECFPRKWQYGPDLDCIGKWTPSNREKQIMDKFAELNETLDDYWTHDSIPDADVCPVGFYKLH